MRQGAIAIPTVVFTDSGPESDVASNADVSARSEVRVEQGNEGRATVTKLEFGSP